jgi:hypothetical protein
MDRTPKGDCAPPNGPAPSGPECKAAEYRDNNCNDAHEDNGLVRQKAKSSRLMLKHDQFGKAAIDARDWFGAVYFHSLSETSLHGKATSLTISSITTSRMTPSAFASLLRMSRWRRHE